MKIAETFTSIQGEGRLTGTLMRFIRLAGCSVTQCPLHPGNKARVGECDTDWRFVALGNVVELADEALQAVGAGGWVSITGGEPLDQPEATKSLVFALKLRGLKVNMQTSGTKLATFGVDWLTVSPKCAAVDLTQALGDELKLVYSGQPDGDIMAFYGASTFPHYYLMPLWANGTHNATQTIAAIKRLNKAGQPWALTTQGHKWWGVR